MTEQKKKLEMHVKIASKMHEEIKKREIDKLQDIEDEIMKTRKVTGDNKADLEKILADQASVQADQSAPPHPLFLDRVRLLVIMILCLKDSQSLNEYI